ncbi:isochorismatase family protein [Leptolyngbya sp. FACHB-541]|uniref:isochorismatase family protein n=1 Tax=Leptolyngbya sp. FACHB-541 TaxID=2692810 RepID=UPI001686FA43|nr:isochorismatase family protein [Leptolyngbya sp. FACHB-541]MBD1995664.1 isochorismatase family protein [Leptolyngbya sp. FACHB-541]
MTSRNAFAESLTPDNAAMLLIDHQVGLFQFLPSVEPLKLKNNIIALAKVAKRFNLPTLLTTSWPQGPNGPTMPELVELFPDHEIMERDTVKFWDHSPSAEAVEKMNRKKLIIAALDTTTCLAFAATYGVQRGYDVYAVMDASSTFDELNQQAAMMRMSAAGVVVTTWVPVLAELANNTVRNGFHIADLLAEHTGSYHGAWSNYIATAKTADLVQSQLNEARKAAI